MYNLCTLICKFDTFYPTFVIPLLKEIIIYLVVHTKDEFISKYDFLSFCEMRCFSLALNESFTNLFLFFKCSTKRF